VDRGGDDEREHRRFARRREAPALDRGQVLADRVDLLNHRPAAQQLRRHRLQIGHRDAFGRQRQQARPPAREQREQQVVRCQRTHALKNLSRPGFAGLVGNRVTGFDHADARGRKRVAIAGDREAVERGADGGRIRIATVLGAEISAGDSVAVNGVSCPMNRRMISRLFVCM